MQTKPAVSRITDSVRHHIEPIVLAVLRASTPEQSATDAPDNGPVNEPGRRIPATKADAYAAARSAIRPPSLPGPQCRQLLIG